MKIGADEDGRCRVRDPEAVSQNCVLRIVRHPLAWLVTPAFAIYYRRLTLDALVVRVRSREGRRNRAPPPRVRWKDGKKVNPAVAAAEEAKAKAAATGAAPAA